MLERRNALLPCFLRRPLAKMDPGSPYGDPDNGHGPHGRGSLVGLLPGSKESTARRDPRSCWHEPRLPATQAGAGESEAPGVEPTAANAAERICHISRT